MALQVQDYELLKGHSISEGELWIVWCEYFGQKIF